MNVQHKAAILISCALYWTFIGSAVLCYSYAGYVILCAIALALTASSTTATAHCRLRTRFKAIAHKKILAVKRKQ